MVRVVDVRGVHCEDMNIERGGRRDETTQGRGVFYPRVGRVGWRVAPRCHVCGAGWGAGWGAGGGAGTRRKLIAPAEVMVLGSDRVPKHPALLCRACYKALHVRADGTVVGAMEVIPLEVEREDLLRVKTSCT